MPLNPTVHDRKTGVTPPGAAGGFELALLDRGAAVLQTSAPLRGFDVYVVGFHCVKGEPDVQMEAHLPEDEQASWHPHNHEVFSGELVAPGLPIAVETELMGHLVNSYGKTWHTWHSTPTGSHPAHDLPIGDPMLRWSFNREGERGVGAMRDAFTGTTPTPGVVDADDGRP